MTFEKFGLAEPILRRRFPRLRHAHPHPIAGDSSRDGRPRSAGLRQTGTGKTAAFALPILHRLTHAGQPPRGRGRRPGVLVLAPTRELAAQIGESFQTYGRYAGAAAHGGLWRRRPESADAGPATGRRHPGRHARPADRPDGPRVRRPRRGRDLRPRRGRPHVGHGVHPRRPPRDRQAAVAAPDAVLLAPPCRSPSSDWPRRFSAIRSGFALPP